VYVTYIVMYAVISSVLGKWVDKQLVKKVSPRDVLKNVGGIQFTILCVIVLLATCIPRGGLALNPKLVEGANAVEDDEEENIHGSAGSDSDHGEKKPQLDQENIYGHQLNKSHGLGNDKLAQSSL
jgi:hypothetical protein